MLLPEAVTPFDIGSLRDRKDRPAPETRPWVMANMVMSADGAHAVGGRSGGLGGPADREVFHTLRAASDAILVAAGTARAERYRRPSSSPEVRAERRAQGLSDAPRLVVVSRRAHIPEDQPFLTGEGPDPLVAHPHDADATLLPDGVEPLAVGHGGVDLRALLEHLRSQGVEQVMCEGGPTLLGQMHQEDLLDELFLTLAPQLVGGSAVGLLGPIEQLPRTVRLHRLLEDDGVLFLTYRRAE